MSRPRKTQSLIAHAVAGLLHDADDVKSGKIQMPAALVRKVVEIISGGVGKLCNLVTAKQRPQFWRMVAAASDEGWEFFDEEEKIHRAYKNAKAALAGMFVRNPRFGEVYDEYRRLGGQHE